MIKTRLKKVIFLLCLGVLLLILAFVSLRLGAFDLSAKEILALILNPNNSTESFVLFHSRIPRIIGAIIIGAALAMSGALYQGVIGNPLVSPGILGVLSGASFGAILAMVLGFNLFGVELFCFIFGLLPMKNRIFHALRDFIAKECEKKSKILSAKSRSMKASLAHGVCVKCINES